MRPDVPGQLNDAPLGLALSQHAVGNRGQGRRSSPPGESLAAVIRVGLVLADPGQQEVSEGERLRLGHATRVHGG